MGFLLPFIYEDKRQGKEDHLLIVKMESVVQLQTQARLFSPYHQKLIFVS